jgi:hypothetical protein
MKKVFFSLMVMSALCSIVSCTKNSTIPAAPVNHNPIVGLWIGTYQVNNEFLADSFYYSFDIRPDSSIITEGSGQNGATSFAIGTWKLSGVNFSATVTAIDAVQSEDVQALTATYDSVGGVLTLGKFVNVGGPATGKSGTFVLQRVQ